jgi:hypothetical protein
LKHRGVARGTPLGGWVFLHPPQPQKRRNREKNDWEVFLHIGLSSGVRAGADFFGGIVWSNVVLFAIFLTTVLRLAALPSGF